MPNSLFPLVTIGITAYNAADTVTRAIDCALNQTWPNTEIIIVNDSSTDSTVNILENYKNTHTKIRIFNQQTNQGVAAARNVILKESLGDYIAFFDDDDVSQLDRVEKQFQRLKNFKNSLAICHTARRQIYPDGAERIEATPGSEIVPDGISMFEKILLGKRIEGGFGSMATCSLMIPKTVVEKIGFYDEKFRRCEDTDFTLRFALAGGNFLGIAEPLVTQTMTLSSEKTLHDEKKFHSDIYFKYKSQLGKGKTRFCLNWLDLRYLFLQGKTKDFALKLSQLFLQHPYLCLQKIIWALPNIGFNFSFKKFHRNAHD